MTDDRDPRKPEDDEPRNESGAPKASLDDAGPNEVAPVPEPNRSRNRIGEQIGRYKLKDQIGRGGMGIVYDAYDPRLHRIVALKLLHDHVLEDRERRSRFLREARLVAKLNHENIVTVYEVGEVGREIFIAMERLKGQSLREVMDAAQGALPHFEAVRIARQIALGVATAHDQGVIHRDIKPDNVMICQDGAVKLLDFGLAKALERGGDVEGSATTDISTQTGHVVGTFLYMSPEQARGRGVDARADVFAIGIVLYEMLTGTRPFGGETGAEVIAAILRDTPPPLTGVPAEISKIVLRCLAKQPDDRYANAGFLAQALDVPQWTTSTHFSQNRWKYVSLVAATVAALSIFLPKCGEPPVVPSDAGVTDAADEALDANIADAVEEPSDTPTETRDREHHTLLDLPTPAFKNEDAEWRYHRALNDFRNAKWGAGEEELRLALNADPDMPLLQLRYALTQMSYEAVDPEAKAYFDKADQAQEKLPPRDRDLLEAVRPMFAHDPPNVKATMGGLETLAVKYHNDPEIFLFLASYYRHDSVDKRLKAARRALAIDPGYADAMQMEAAALFESDPHKAMKVLGDCKTNAYMGNDCAGEIARLNGLRGFCPKALETMALAVKEPDASTWLFALQPALLYGANKPEADVLLGFQKHWEHSKGSSKAYDRALLDVAFGHFDEAMRKAQNGLDSLGSNAKLSKRTPFELLLVEIALEKGDEQKAGEWAKRFIDLRKDSDPASLLDQPVVYLARTAWKNAQLSDDEFLALRDAFRAKWIERRDSMTPIQQAKTWATTYVMGIDEPTDASEALEKIKGNAVVGALRHDYGSNYVPRIAALGRALWLTGREEEKSDALRHFAITYQRCDMLTSIFSVMRSNLLYAKALEEKVKENQSTDASKACEVYQSILRRWGKATPHSVTANKAKEAIARLGCAN